ncbi:MAG: hypothetical protein AAFW87_02820 [Pseudomonadota bacterium]
MCATLISQGPNGQDIYVVEQTAPEGFDSKGAFIGGDGYFALEFTDGAVTLSGAARFKPGPRTEAASARCLLLGENEPGATVHFKANYVPWQDELLPSEFRTVSDAYRGGIA